VTKSTGHIKTMMAETAMIQALVFSFLVLYGTVRK